VAETKTVEARTLTPLRVLGGPVTLPQHEEVGGGLAAAFTESVLTLALLMRLHPRLFFRRQIDRVTIERDRFMHSVAQEVRLPSDLDLSGPVLIPIGTGRRNALRDDSHVAVSNGHARRLTSAEEMEFAELSIVTAYERALKGGNVEERYLSAYHKHLESLKRIPYSSRDAGAVAITHCLQWIDSIGFVSSGDKVASLLAQGLFFVETFVQLIEVRGLTDQELTITRASDEPPPEGESQGLNALLQRLFGRQDRRIALEFSDVTDARSFHAFVTAPPGQHFHDQGVGVRPDRSGARKTEQPVETRRYRTIPMGTDQAHIYFHTATESDALYLRERGIRWTVHLAEDLPGTLLPAWVSSVMLLAIGLITTVLAESKPSDARQLDSKSCCSVPGVPADDSGVVVCHFSAAR
jgi:hypothetical protein